MKDINKTNFISSEEEPQTNTLVFFLANKDFRKTVNLLAYDQFIKASVMTLDPSASVHVYKHCFKTSILSKGDRIRLGRILIGMFEPYAQVHKQVFRSCIDKYDKLYDK